MRSPGDDQVRDTSGHCEQAPIGRLKRRADFLRAGKGRRWHGKALTLQMCEREAPDPDAARVGFTLTKKVGCAVVRNRARRRLREATRLSLRLPVRLGHDYVVVGRLDAIRLSFTVLRDELARAVHAVHGAGIESAGRRRKRHGNAPNHDMADPRPPSSRGADAGTDPAWAAPERTKPEP